MRISPFPYLAAAITMICTIAASGGLPAPMTGAPIDRVVANLEARIKAAPNDADAHYSLGRAHALVYSSKSKTIYGYGSWEKDTFEPNSSVQWSDLDVAVTDAKDTPTDADRKQHLRLGLHHLCLAIRQDRHPRYYLALASLLEFAKDDLTSINVRVLTSSADPVDQTDSVTPALDSSKRRLQSDEEIHRCIFYNTLDVKSLPFADQALEDVWRRRDLKEKQKVEPNAILTDFWQELARDSYFIAFSLSLASEPKVNIQPIGSMHIRISLESANGFKRLSSQPETIKRDGSRIAIVEAAIPELAKEQNDGSVTPVIFSLDNASLASLSTNNTVPFDLDGTGTPQKWSWIQPCAGMLVWDPYNSGRITSGRQLFGSVTWWVMFNDGYKALDALDDNRDGWLAADELKGIAAWFDENSNGVSDSGEVRSLASLCIQAIATKPDSIEDNCLAARAGLRLTNGRTLPTFDWIATRKE